MYFAIVVLYLMYLKFKYYSNDTGYRTITHVCIYIYIHIKKPTLMYVTAGKIKKSHIFFIQIHFGTVFLRQCIFVCVCVCVKDTCWKFSIYYKFTIKESLKLTKGITWRHSNIVLKLEKMKFTNTLKNNVQLGEEINGTKGTKQLQNKKTNIKHKTACLSQLINRGRRCRSNRKNLFSPHCCLVKVINK